MPDLLDVEIVVSLDDGWRCFDGSQSVGSAGGFGRWRGDRFAQQERYSCHSERKPREMVSDDIPRGIEKG